MENKQYRPRLSGFENEVIIALRSGFLGDIKLPEELEYEPETVSPARVLIFDIETAPLRSYTWATWKQNIAPSQMISEWFMITWAAKWLFEEEVLSEKLTPEEILKEDDLRITKKIWKLVNEADIIIAHNANKFDVKRLNTRFLMNGIEPPMPYRVIDTLDHARRQFAFSSNKMDALGERLGIGRKIKTEFELWANCMGGDKKAIAEMETYNIQDVIVLEELYLKLRPWIKSHPNIGLYIDEDVDACPNCGSQHLDWTGDTYATSASLFEAFRCMACGAVGRSAKSLSANKERPRVTIRPTSR